MTAATSLILGTIKAVAEAITEGFRYAQTLEGQRAAAKWLDDAVAREKWLDEAGAWMKKFVTGELLK